MTLAAVTMREVVSPRPGAHRSTGPGKTWEVEKKNPRSETGREKEGRESQQAPCAMPGLRCVVDGFTRAQIRGAAWIMHRRSPRLPDDGLPLSAGKLREPTYKGTSGTCDTAERTVDAVPLAQPSRAASVNPSRGGDYRQRCNVILSRMGLKSTDQGSTLWRNNRISRLFRGRGSIGAARVLRFVELLLDPIVGHVLTCAQRPVLLSNGRSA